MKDIVAESRIDDGFDQRVRGFELVKVGVLAREGLLSNTRLKLRNDLLVGSMEFGRELLRILESDGVQNEGLAAILQVSRGTRHDTFERHTGCAVASDHSLQLCGISVSLRALVEAERVERRHSGLADEVVVALDNELWISLREDEDLKVSSRGEVVQSRSTVFIEVNNRRLQVRVVEVHSEEYSRSLALNQKEGVDTKALEA